MWKTHIETLIVRKMIINIDEKLPGLISEWYIENKLPEPFWRIKKPYFDSEGNIIRPE